MQLYSAQLSSFAGMQMLNSAAGIGKAAAI
jgi:hypothetical protein